MTKIKNGSKTEIFDGPGVSSKVGDITYWKSVLGPMLAVYPDKVYFLDNAFWEPGKYEFKIMLPDFYKHLKHIFNIQSNQAEWEELKSELIKQIMGV